MALKHHNYVVDPQNSVLLAPESKTRYPGQCWPDISIIDKISFSTKQVHIQENNMTKVVTKK